MNSYLAQTHGLRRLCDQTTVVGTLDQALGRPDENGARQMYTLVPNTIVHMKMCANEGAQCRAMRQSSSCETVRSFVSLPVLLEGETRDTYVTRDGPVTEKSMLERNQRRREVEVPTGCNCVIRGDQYFR